MSEIVGKVEGRQDLEGNIIPRGNDGISPVVTVNDMGDGYKILITDIYGTKRIDLLHGRDGIVPRITVDKIDGGHRINIESTVNQPAISFDVMDGADILTGTSVPTDDPTMVGKLFMEEESGSLMFCFMYSTEMGGCQWAVLFDPTQSGGELTAAVVQKMIERAVKDIDAVSKEEFSAVEIDVSNLRSDVNDLLNQKDEPNPHAAVESLIETDMLPAVHDASGAILTDENGNVILRY